MAENASAQIRSRIGAVSAGEPSGLVVGEGFDAVGRMTFPAEYLFLMTTRASRALNLRIGPVAVQIGEGMRRKRG
jgi:hypothetical protein